MLLNCAWIVLRKQHEANKMINIQKIYLACCDVIDTDNDKWIYWQELKCSPELWFQFLIRKVLEMEFDDVEKCTRDRLSSFILLMEESIIHDAPKSITDFLEYMMSLNPLNDDICNNWSEYKLAAEIIVKCFEEASGFL